MNYDEMERRVKAIIDLTREIEHCQHLGKVLDGEECEMLILSRGVDCPSSIPPWLNTRLSLSAKDGLFQRIQRLRDNIKIIEEMGENVRLDAESTPADDENKSAEQRVVNAGETN
jgi:hypothetical protein